MPGIDDPVLDVERQRLELEENVRKLRQSLYDWRIREAEYDDLKEGFKSLEEDCTKDEILQHGIDLQGTVIDEKEVKALVGYGTAIVRSRDQVIQQISRRLDYVKQNISSLEKRLETAEANLDNMLSIERPGPNTAEEQHAVTEVFEELDEDGNVISSRISTPGDRAPEVIEILKKAGVEVPQDSKPEQSTGTIEEAESKDQEKFNEASQNQDTVKADSEKITPVRDSVDAETGDSDDSDSEPPVSEVDEPLEDAKLRREMLEYGFHEVGKVVAELEMDEDGSDFSYEDDDYDDNEYEDDEEDEYGRTTTPVITEEYHQRMKELQKKLEAGGFINLGPAKDSPAEISEAIEKPGIMKAVSAKKEENGETKPAQKKAKKKVAFATELDIAQEPTSVLPKAERKVEPVRPETAPLSESIVERSSSKPTANKNAAVSDSVPKKASRFKAARSSGFPTPGDSSSPGLGMGQSTVKRTGPPPAPPSPASLPLFPAKPKEPKPFSQPIVASDIFAKPPTVHSEPQPPEGKTLADNLVERPAVNRTGALPPEPDEVDDEIHRKEVASEFYRLRNRKIQQNGGFLNEDEDGELYELDENDQPKKRVSKFKAARVRP